MNSYVLVTPARNEGKYLPNLIESIDRQTVKPIKWVIVSDASTDNTYEIAAMASKNNPAILSMRNKGSENRSFGSKILAFKAGYDLLNGISFNYIGNLDADITLEPNYFERILEEMAKNSRLGIASGVVWDKTEAGYKRAISNLNHAVGGAMFWRKECFDAVGGYRLVTVCGEDSIAERTARMNGWETKSFPYLPIYHHKPVDSANAKTGVRIAYRAGLTDYHIGTHPFFAILKAIRRWRQSPFVLSALIRIFAYFKLWAIRAKRDAPGELVAYIKNEQMEVLRNAIINIGRR